MRLTGENWSTGRKTLYSVGGRWMNEYGAMVEWYWQGKTEVLGEKNLFLGHFQSVASNQKATVTAVHTSKWTHRDSIMKANQLKLFIVTQKKRIMLAKHCRIAATLNRGGRRTIHGGRKRVQREGQCMWNAGVTWVDVSMRYAQWWLLMKWGTEAHCFPVSRYQIYSKMGCGNILFSAMWTAQPD